VIKGTKLADNVNVSTLAGYDGWYEGGSGNDIIQGSIGDDTLRGGKDNDIVVGDAGNDSIKSDSGDDIVFGGGQDDIVYAGEGNDFASGDAGDDYVSGGRGDDTLAGSWGADYVDGGSGNDVITGDGPDGNTENDEGDVLLGRTGDDTISGGAGADLIIGGAGTDVMTGGDGSDLFSWSLSDVRTAFAADTITDFNAFEDVIDLATLLQYVTGDKAAAVRLTDGVDGTMVEAQVSTDKTFMNVALIEGAHELDLNSLIADGHLFLV
jgi:Ca2+-binding RTX toxin-like protein